MKSQVLEALAKVQMIDFRQIRFKLANDKDGERWSIQDIEKAQLLYTCFITLLLAYRHLPITLAPPVLADKFWHQHILDTRKYMKDCNELFGEYLHHFPYFGMRGKEDAEELQTAGRTTWKLMEEHFGHIQACRELFDELKVGDCSNCGGSCSSCKSCKAMFQDDFDLNKLQSAG